MKKLDELIEFENSVKVLLVGLLVFFQQTTSYSAEPVTSNCNWKPADKNLLINFYKKKEKNFCSQNGSDDCDNFLVAEKGPAYLYSLPNQKCKSETFIIFRDVVAALDYFPDRSGAFSDGNYVQIVYNSKKLNKNISGWIEMRKLCRLNFAGYCPSNDLTPR